VSEGLALYFWTFPALTLMSVLLAFSGVHFASRDQTVQSLSIAQGAELGALAFMIWTLDFEHLHFIPGTWGSLVMGVGSAFFAGFFAERVSRVNSGNRSVSLFSLWIFLLVLSQLIVALHPSLESHFSRGALGDVSTLTQSDSQFLLLLLCLAGVLMFLKRNAFLYQSFSVSVLSLSRPSRTFDHSLMLYFIAALGTWSMGFVYTCAAMYIPTTILAWTERPGAQRHIFLCCLSAVLAAPLGLYLALQRFPNLPTAPLLIALLILTSSLLAVIDAGCERLFRPRS
jgi:ABC-type Mn2+/Zn2+ transport system permease subunit